ncbi:hypothetical protein AB0M43_37980 [Longispora sp. NPDC051575]
MKKLWVYVGAAFAVFVVVTNPNGSADFAHALLSGLTEFGTNLVGGAR